VAADCARKAGFHVTQVISEPAAACLAYGLGQVDNDESLRCVVFRVGGTSLACSVVLVNAGLYSVISSEERPGIGGETVTKKMADFLAEEFQRLFYRLFCSRSSRLKATLVPGSTKSTLGNRSAVARSS
jgi:molecular chaperone DnaK (HSP70)